MTAPASGTRTASLVLLRVVCALCIVFSAGGLGDTATPFADRVLVATFGVGMGLFGLALTWLLDSGSTLAWQALWYLPAFLALHVALLGVWVPDLPLALLAVGALVALRPRSSDVLVAAP
jgi:hypothetical protein